MIIVVIVKYEEPNEKRWFEVELLCGQKFMTLPGSIMWTEEEARKRAQTLADFAPAHFLYDPTLEVQ
jgi:hypothetical protein